MIIECINCGGLNECYPSQKKKYCDNVCQSEFEYKTYIDKWLRGEETGNVGKHEVYISNHVRRWLKDQYGERCWICGWSKINPHTNRCPLQVNHIDGNWKRTTPDNIELICPNCHSLTENFGSRNKNGRRSVIEG